MTDFNANIGGGTAFSAGMGSAASSPPDPSDLVFHAKTRSGTTLIDQYGNDAKVLAPCFLRVSDPAAGVIGDSTRDVEHWFDGNNYTAHFKLRFMVDVPVSGTADIFTLGGGRTATRRGMELRTVNNNLWFYICDGATQYSISMVTDVNGNLKSQDVYDVHITVSGSADQVTCTLYDSDGAQVGNAMDQDISAFVMSNSDNYGAIKFYSPYAIVDNFKKFSAVKTLVQCQTDTYRTDMQIHVPNVFAGADISGNGYDFSHSNLDETDIHYEDLCPWPLDYGFDRYEIGLDAAYGRTVCRDTDNNAYIPGREGGDVFAASRIVNEEDGGYFMNMDDCKIRFTHDFFDRSDVTIWGAAARTGYYDSGNTKDFHVSELNQKTLYDWLNVGYKGRLYVNFADNSIEKYDRKYIKEIFLYGTDRTLIDNRNVLAYTGDIMAAVLDGNDDITYDGNNYVQLGTLKSAGPMLTIRFDDGFLDQFTDYKPFFDTFGISALVGIHAAEVGTGNYATWATLLSAYNDGYEICSTNNYDNDYSNLDMVDAIEQDMTDAINTQEAQGMDCDYHFGNRHSTSNPSTFYFAHKVLHSAQICASDYGKDRIHGANPQEVDLFRLCAMAVDVNVPSPNPYYLSQLPNATQIQAIKDHMNTVVSGNRWLIIYVHTYNVNVKDGLQEVLDYWETTLGQSFYSMSEAVANCKYL